MDYISLLAVNAIAFLRNAVIGTFVGIADARSSDEILTGDEGLEGILKQSGAGFFTELGIDAAGVLAYNQHFPAVMNDNYGGIAGLAVGLRIGKKIYDCF